MTIDSALIERLYKTAGCERWRVPKRHFAEALERSAVRGGEGRNLEGRDLERYLGRLHLEDLALACACALGDERAWDHFVLEYRPVLYRAADVLDPSGSAREIADSLYAELFGLRETDGVRQSLFRYFHGRSSLRTWLRAVLAQRHVDRLRSVRRIEPIPEDESPAAFAAPVQSIGPDRARFARLIALVLARVVAALSVRDRLRLACYYAQEMTLAETGRVLREHEATTSRHLAKTRTAIRVELERRLKLDHGLSEAEISECFENVVEDAGSIDLRRMMADGDDRKNSMPERSTEGDVA